MMSGVLIGLITGSLLMYFYNSRKEQKEESEPEECVNEDSVKEENVKEDKKEEEPVPDDVDTMELVKDALTMLGCQYDVDEEDERIGFIYQGAFFNIYTSKGSAMITICFFLWLDHDLEDIDGFSELRRIINEENKWSDVITVYNIDEQVNKVTVHSRKSIVFVPQIPNYAFYLKSMFHKFFETRHNITTEFLRTRPVEVDD